MLAIHRTTVLAFVAFLVGCADDPVGLHPSPPARTTVKYDFFHRPLPEIPLPNDIATRVDATSATGRRLNASMVSPTALQSRMRELLDRVDGWGVLQPLTIPFTGPLDVASIVAGHRDADYDTSNDVIYLVNIDRRSPEFGRVHHLDLGEGNYPVVIEENNYGPNDPRGDTMSLLFEETAEDVNGNGILDPVEDTDADGVLDVPNYLPGATPARDDLAGRADALMTFYERETNTLIATPLVPLRERTTYAVVVTRRLLDAGGEPVGSPFPWIHHLAQTETLRPLAQVLAPLGLDLDDVAFAFTYTTQSIEASWLAVRDGLYGHGVQRHLGEQFPPDVSRLLRLRDPAVFPGSGTLQLLHGEQWAAGLALIEEQLLGGNVDRYDQRLILDGQRYVDYYVMGSFDSPQLFARTDAAGDPLPFNDQSWPADLDRVAAPAVAEKLTFTLAVPRKEVSVRGQGRPAPLVILLHGHGGQRFTAMSWSAYFCKYGLAVLAIDGPSHGISLGDLEKALAASIVEDVGLRSTVAAVFQDRAFDQNNDGIPDSGADFWTAYLFHTRDMVRQFALDLMQTVRVVRGFDGNRRWAFDLDGDGTNDIDGLAGDFDGDGVLDVGGDAPIVVTGGSLGGMMTMVIGSLEPEVTAIAPIVGGGMLSSIGIRSTNGGAQTGLVIRAMTPIYLGDLDPATGVLALSTLVPDALEQATVPLAFAQGVAAGDTMVVENLANGERGCGMVDAQGRVRASVESDLGDRTRVVFYRGPVIVPGGECDVAAGATPVATVDTFGRNLAFQGTVYTAGQPLQALAEGFGLRRANPELRRIQGIAQLILDPGDPAVYATHLLAEPLAYPATGQKTGAHSLMVFTEGDTSVPNAAGMVVARAAGLLDYLTPDPRYGVPPNQVLIDTFVAEGVNTLRRHVDRDGVGVHIDVENFSNGDDVWTARDLPRLDPPLRLGLGATDRLGGSSAAFFVLTDPVGDHGFSAPGSMIEDARVACVAGCMQGGADPCGCSTAVTYDVGLFLVNMVGRYLASVGSDLRVDRCQAEESCADIAPVPAARAPEAIY